MKNASVGVAVVAPIIDAGALFVRSQPDSIAAGPIGSRGSAATGTAVRVGSASIRLAEASGAIRRPTRDGPRAIAATGARAPPGEARSLRIHAREWQA